MIRHHKDKYTLNKSNTAISISNNLTSLEKKFFNHAICIAQQDLSTLIYSVNAREFSVLIGKNSNRQTHKKIEKIFHRLLGKVIDIIAPTETEFCKTTYFASVELKEGIIYFQFSENLKKHICIDVTKNPKSYTKLDLNILNLLTSTHSIALYENLKSKTFATNSISLDVELLTKLVCNKTKFYQSFSQFNYNVLKKAVEEINIKTDMFISYDTIKLNDNKKVSKVKFSVNYKNTKDIVINTQKSIQTEINNINTNSIQYPKNIDIKIDLNKYPKELEEIINIGIKPASKVIKWFKEDQRRLLANWHEVSKKYQNKNNIEKARLMAHLWKVNANYLTKAEIEEKEKEKAYNIKQEAILKEKQEEEKRQEKLKREAAEQSFINTGKIYNQLSDTEKLEICKKICKGLEGIVHLRTFTKDDKYLDFNNLRKSMQASIINEINPINMDSVQEAPQSFISYKENEKREADKALKNLFGG